MSKIHINGGSMMMVSNTKPGYDLVRKVMVKVIISRIRNINLVESSFLADFYIVTKWEEPKLNGISINDVLNLDDFWNPKLQMENIIGEITETRERSFDLDARGNAIITDKCHIIGTISHNFQLRQFPFDKQDITLSFTSKHPIGRFEFIQSDVSFIQNPDEQSPDWKIAKYLELRTGSVYDEIHQVNRDSLKITLKILRKPDYYILNYFLVMFLICIGIPLTWMMDVLRLHHVRMSLSFSITFSALGFKFIIAETLPKIPYMTYIDIYILIALISNLSVATWHGATYLIIDDEAKKTADNYAMWIALGAFTVYHIIYYGIMAICYIRHKRELEESEKKHQRRVVRDPQRMIGPSMPVMEDKVTQNPLFNSRPSREFLVPSHR
ncbi:unnamed protein product [Owenia fusiformis]|uniref:Neurotransmitter-gated ion-channel ligand-binding domain-containing protein n=1 Tax=Owenia fusiformis TaxID=6347 RepID=A0A8S4Q5A4_OWEFU|nr:unnamed protein product [Owenia fusiformis]